MDVRRKDGSLLPVEARVMVVELPSGTVYLTAIRNTREQSMIEPLWYPLDGDGRRTGEVSKKRIGGDEAPERGALRELQCSHR